MRAMADAENTALLDLGWIQRMAYGSFTNNDKCYVHKQQFTVSDGHTCSVWWKDRSPFVQQSTVNDVVLVLPGFYDSWRALYIKHCIDAVERHLGTAPGVFIGVFHKPYVVDPVTSKNLVTTCDPIALTEVLAELAKRFSNARFHLIGCSAGGNMVFKAVNLNQATYGLEGRIENAVAVCSPLDMVSMDRRMVNSHWVIQRILWLSCLLNVLLKLFWLDPWAWILRLVKFLFTFDYASMANVMHCDVFGFETREKFCQSESAMDVLQKADHSVKKRIVVFTEGDQFIKFPRNDDFHPQVERIFMTTGNHVDLEEKQWDLIVQQVWPCLG
jgi:predicted alpha/beta-fold hydrolase